MSTDDAIKKLQGNLTAGVVLGLRRSGMLIEEIALELKADEGQIRRYLKQALSYAAESAEDIKEIKQIELERIDAYQSSLWAKAKTGDVEAIKASLLCMQHRMKLLGLAAPVQVQVEHSGDPWERKGAKGDVVDMLLGVPQIKQVN